MTTNISVLLYGVHGNNAVVKMPGRRNAGVVIQADTLRNLVEQARIVADLAKKDRATELRGEAESLLEELHQMFEKLHLEVQRAGENLEI